MWAVMFVAMVDFIGFGIILPIFPFFATALGAKPEVVMVFIALYMAAAFVSAPIMGRLSDRYGRKPVMLVSLFGATLGYLLLASATSLWVVALARIISGAMAGSISAAEAYVVDHTNEDTRARYMGLLSAAMALGYVIGPAIGSLLAGDGSDPASIVAPALVSAGLSLTGLIALMFLVKEDKRTPHTIPGPTSHRPEDQTTDDGMLTILRSVLRHRSLLVVFCCAVLYNLSSGLYETIFPLWAEALHIIDMPSGLLPMLLTSALAYIIVQAAAIEPLTKRFEHKTLLCFSSLGFALSIAGMIIAGNHASVLGTTLTMMFTASCAGIIIPVIHIMASNLAEEDQRGAVLGLMSSAGTLARTLSTAGSGLLFAQWTVHAPYYLAVVAAVTLYALVWRMVR